MLGLHALLTNGFICGKLIVEGRTKREEMQWYHAGGVMKKVILAILLVCIIFVGILIIYKLTQPKEPIDNGVLIINGRVLEDTNVTIYALILTNKGELSYERKST